MSSRSEYSSGIESDFSSSPRSCFSFSTSNDDSNGKPKLRITKQPNKHHLFRYETDKRSTNISATVELLNCVGRPKIECYLVHYDVDKIHPNWLEKGKQSRYISQVMPKYKSSVRFNNMNVIQAKYSDIDSFMKANGDFDSRHKCEKNKHIVRIKFTAYDENGIQICDPVISKPVFDTKCAITTRLEIVRISRSQGNPQGGYKVYCLISKVSKSDILIRIVEYEENGSIRWTISVKPQYVHHQYAIIIVIPPYQDQYLAQSKQVWLQLYRPSDHSTSEFVSFIYDPKEPPQNDYSTPNPVANSAEATQSTVLADTIPEQISIPQDIPYENFYQDSLKWDMISFDDMVTDCESTKVDTRKREEINGSKTKHQYTTNDSTNVHVQKCVEDVQCTVENNDKTNIVHVQANVHNECAKTNPNHEIDSVYSVLEDFNVAYNYAVFEAVYYRDSINKEEPSDKCVINNESEVLEEDIDVFETAELENRTGYCVDKALDVKHERPNVDIECTAVDDKSVEQAELQARVNTRLNAVNLPDLVGNVKQYKDGSELEDNTEENSSSEDEGISLDDSQTDIETMVKESFLSTKSVLRVLQQIVYVLIIFFILQNYGELL